MRKQSLVRGLFAALIGFFFFPPANAQTIPDPCPNAQPVPEVLHLPANLPVSGEDFEYEQRVLNYLNTLDYRKLGWCEDKGVRDTGPFINNLAAVVHPGVRIFYSHEVSDWLRKGRQGVIPDGAVIIKEQFPNPPAERLAGIPPEKLGCPNDWTFMIKNSNASRDGWFWGELFPMDFKNPNKFQYPNTGYGIYCLRCHASAEKELTFASLKNIKGAPEFPLQYRVDDSWRSGIQPLLPTATCTTNGPSGAQFKVGSAFPSHAQNVAIMEELAVEKLLTLTPPPGIQRFPPEPLDNVIAPPGKASKVSGAGVPPEFVTSSQCLTCHSGLSTSPFGPSMAHVFTDEKGNPIDNNGKPIQETKKPPTGVNFSAYGEWRWSPMGLAGRDPVFYSQLESELAFLKGDTKTQQGVIDTCLTCHGAMGKKSFAIEHPNDPFQLDFIYETDPSAKGFKYGGLARDGISCLMCHRNAPPAKPGPEYFFTAKDNDGKFLNINGNFNLVPADQVYGPFKDDEITTYPMDTGLGVKPKFNAYLQSSQMCGSCHTIILPVLDKTITENGKQTHPFEVEQATYPEWLNSQYRNEYGSVGAKPESCQFCHMPTGYSNELDNDAKNKINIQPIQTRIAVTQDLTYPEADHVARPDQLNVRYRKGGYRRHEFLGTNGFLLQMFLNPLDGRDNNEILGVRLPDYFTGFLNDLKDATANVVTQAQTITADVEITNRQALRGVLTVDVTVTNKTGHRFPSGVGFRRAFLEFVVKDKKTGQVVFSSGTTNAKGEITNMAGDRLLTERHVGNAYQPHFNRQNPIESSDQVQIYEELVKDAKGNLTFSFTHRDEEVKDNRLLPIGWSQDGPKDLKLPEQILKSTMPKGEAEHDQVYMRGEGQSVVRYVVRLPQGKNERNYIVEVKLYSQTLPQDFLEERYQTSGKATERLHYLANLLGNKLETVKDTPPDKDTSDKDVPYKNYKNWKLLIAQAKSEKAGN